MVHSHSKNTQLRTLCRWLSREALPAHVESYVRVLLWCRREADAAQQKWCAFAWTAAIKNSNQRMTTGITLRMSFLIWARGRPFYS